MPTKSEMKYRIYDLERQVNDLEALRPLWAQGYSSDSIAAQSLGNVVADYWGILGVDNHTAGMRCMRRHFIKENNEE